MITFVTFIVYNCIAFFESFIKQDFAHCTFSVVVVLSDGYLLSALWWLGSLGLLLFIPTTVVAIT